MKRIISLICLVSMIFTLAMPTQLIASAAVGDSIDVGSDKIVFNGLNYKKIDKQVGPYDFDTNGTLSTFSPGGSYAVADNTVADFATRTGGSDTQGHDNVFVYAGASRSRLYFNRYADTIEAEVAGMTFDLYFPDGLRTDGTNQLLTAFVFGNNSKTSTALTTIKTGKSGLYYDGNLVFEIPTAEWINISLLFDFVNDTVTFIADDVVIDTVEIGEDMVSLGRLEGWLGRPVDGELYIDNYGIYGYESVPYDATVFGVDEYGEITSTVNNVSGSKIAVKFEPAMDPETLPGNVTVKDAAGTEVAIADFTAEAYDVSTDILYIQLAEDIANGEEYKVVLNSSVKTADYYGFDEEKEYSFLALGEISYSYGVVTKVDNTAKTITIHTAGGEDVAYDISGKTIVNGDVYENTAMKAIVPSGAFVRYMPTSSNVLRVIDFDAEPVVYSEVHYDEDTGEFTLIEEDIADLPMYSCSAEISYESDYEGTFNEPLLSRRYKYVVEVFDYGVNIKENIALFEEYDITEISLASEVTADYTHDLTVSFKIKENTSFLIYELYNSTLELIDSNSLVYEQYNSGEAVSKFTITDLPNVTDEYTLKLWVQDTSGELVSPIYDTNKINITKVLTESERIDFGKDSVIVDGVEYIKGTTTATVDFDENGTVNTLCASTTSYPVGTRVVADFAEYTGLEDTENHGNVFIEPYNSEDISKRLRLANTALYGGVYVIEYDVMYTSGTVASSKQMWSPKLYLESGSYNWGPSLFYAKDSSYLFKNEPYTTFEPGIWKNIAVMIDTERDVCSFVVDGKLVLADQPIGYAITGVSTIEAFLYPKEDGEAFLDNITIYQYYPRFKATGKGVNEGGALIGEADYHQGSEMAVVFSADMDATTFAGNVKLTNKSGEEIKILEVTEANYDATTKVLKLTIDEDIEPDAVYNVVLGATLTDAQGTTVKKGVTTTNGIGYDEDYIVEVKTSKPEFSISDITMGIYSVKNLPAGRDISAKLVLKTDGAVDSKLVIALYADGKLCSIDAKEVAAADITAAETLTISVPAAGTYGESPKYQISAFILGDNYETLDFLTKK